MSVQQPEQPAEDHDDLVERVLRTIEDQMLGIAEPPAEGVDIPIDFDMEMVRNMMRHFGDRAMEWAGMPVPIPDFPLRVESRYPWAGLQHVFDAPPDVDDARPMLTVRNSWYSRTKQMTVYLCEDDDGEIVLVKKRYSDTGERLNMWVSTMGATAAWDLDAEYQARRKLRSLITPHLFAMYELTGAFFESSPRSGLIYIIRRARPTIVLTTFKFGGAQRSIPDPDALGMKILAAMCLHPIAYYDGTWAGAMVPTDDAIAHLLMIRGDEALYWRRANQHRIHSALAGL